jgi:putative ferrous iron transport protein C
MLTDLQTYIANHGTVTLADLALHFRTDGEAIRPMLAKLSRKGRIRKHPTQGTCGGCTSCNPASLECYEWVKQSGDNS